MKNALFTGILLLFQYIGIACTFIPNSFCQTLVAYPDDVVLTGVIVAIDDTGIDMEIIEVLRGEESREVIRIWDGTDFDCNGIWSMAASDIGDLSDTIIIMLPKILEIENIWDVIGDYRRPQPYLETSELLVQEGNATGFILGDAIAPPEYNLWSRDYEDFKNSIIADGDCSSIILSTNDSNGEPIMTVNNPFESHLYIQLESEVGKGNVKLYAMTGNIVLAKEFNAEHWLALEVQDVPSGIYLLALKINGRQEVMKLVKLDSR